MSLLQVFLDNPYSWILLAVAGLGTYFYLKLRRPVGFPAGLPVVPFLGSIPFMEYGGDKFHLEFERISKTYGPIFSLALGHEWVVVLNDYDLIKEALVEKAVEFSGRIADPRMDLIHPKLPVRGIIDGDYSDEWVKQRHNALMLMRNFGWGKKGIAEKMSEERDILLEILRDSDEKPLQPGYAINVSVMNIICSMMFGDRFNHDDPRLGSLIKSLDTLIAATSKSSEWDYVPVISKFVPGVKQVWEELATSSHNLYDAIDGQIKKRRDQLTENPDDEPRDFIENYLKELKNRETGKAKIREDWLSDICVDFFIAGSETTTTTLKWSLIYMVHNPDVQRKIQAELDEVVGKPSGKGMTVLVDRHKLSYTDAAIMEVQRLSAIVPTALTHKTTTDVQLGGYKIPKNTQVRYNVYSVLHDPKHWDDPYRFKPERFLSQDGKVTKNDKWIPFGMGRRMCLGEQLARQELFMFFSAIIHNFTISMPGGAELPSLEPAVHGVILAPSRREFIFQPRF